MEPQLETLLAHGEEHGCIELSEVDEAAQAMDLDDDEVQALYEESSGAEST